MLKLRVSEGEVEAALPFLGARLERWRAGVTAKTAMDPPAKRSRAHAPRLTARCIFVSRRGLEAALAALLGLRGWLLNRLALREGIQALSSLDPVLRAIEDVFALHRPKETCIR